MRIEKQHDTTLLITLHDVNAPKTKPRESEACHYCGGTNEYQLITGF